MPHNNGTIQDAVIVNRLGTLDVGVVAGVPNRLAVDAFISGGTITVSTIGTPRTASVSQDLSAAPVALSLAPGVAFEPRFVAVKFSVALPAIQLLTITWNSVLGAAFDTIIRQVRLGAGTTDYFFDFPTELLMAAGDAIDLAITNTGAPVVTANAVIRGES